MTPRLLIATALWAASTLAFAQTAPLPKPAEFYFDADAGTQRPVLELKDRSPAAIERLTRGLARRPSAQETAQLAHYALESGQASGRALYAQALAMIDTSSSLWKPIRWTYGWDLYRAGDAEGALAQWAPLAARGTTAAWMPPTFAMALWTLGRRDEAVRWYAAAVRTEPALWSTPAQHAQLLPQWRDAERATLAEVQAAWAANPPSWP